MAAHPFEGFDGLIAKAAAILEAEGQPASWKIKNRRWYAQQIVVTNDFMLKALAEGDARMAALWGIRLGGLIHDAGARNLSPPAAAGGKARAAAKAELHRDWRRLAEVLRAQHPEWSASRLAKAIDSRRWQTVRKVI